LSLEVWEILNYVAAAEAGLDWIKRRPITSGLIFELQRVLVRGTPGEHSDVGGLRDRQVVVGSRDSAVPDARFVPPPPGDELRAGVDGWVGWVTDPPTDLSPGSERQWLITSSRAFIRSPMATGASAAS
jgi:Fic family protein